MNQKYKFPKIVEDEDLIKKVFFPEDLEVNAYRAYQGVYPPYEIEGEFIVSKRSPIKAKAKTYNPLQVDNLIEAIIKIDTRSAESILEFCNQYGLLTTGGLFEECGFAQKEELEAFIFEVNLLKKCVEVYWKLQNNVFTENVSDDLFLNIERGLITLEGEPVSFLAYTISQHLRGLRLEVIKSPNGEYVPRFACSNLITAAYYQLFKILTENKKLSKCKNCGSLFVPRRSNAYCPPQPGERSTCENRYNQMVFWARKKILSGEKTIEEVARMKGRPIEEVRGWIEDYNTNSTPKASKTRRR